uniref:Uncharacterized protein n=1 Tax=Glossina pallidipes TaxID=7398 RepID=A0A1A9ZV77_GLOPL
MEFSPNLMKISTPPTRGFYYALFLYREQLQRCRKKPYKIAAIKFNLTEALVKKTLTNVYNCSSDDLEFLSRGTVYKNKLKNHLISLRNNYRMQKTKEQAKCKAKMTPTAATTQQIKQIKETSGCQPTLKRKVSRQLWPKKEDGHQEKRYKVDDEKAKKTC